MKRLLPFVVFVVSFARAETIVTSKGQKFEQATISRSEPDGLIITHATGVAKVPFEELSKELQDKYHYDAAAAKRFIAANQTPLPMPSPPLPPIQISANPSASAESNKPIDAKVEPTALQRDTRANQVDDPQFDDLRRRDWYEDLKAQEKLRNRADFMLALIRTSEKDGNKGFEKCTPTFFKMLADERKAHRENYQALAAIAEKIIQTKDYGEYRNLKRTENQILADIETQKIIDHNDVMELRLHVSERDAELLEITHRYE